MKQKINVKRLQEIGYGMSQMAMTHPNDMIANNLARVSEKVSAYGLAWSEKLTPLDFEIIRYYLAKKRLTE